ncbi:hypothetical protein PHET_03561 [Paragonimus heterotremus]|uniref:C3H1-type domain-containing protein n=1 Tax=Paragonimus heterotremus TaxID=100268 RepID=A0A8J4TDV8_9TREM|nr:hypothetical protein PHET_03561 [Paragonimus heterotremus]
MFYAADTLSLLKANTQESLGGTCTPVPPQNESTTQLPCEFQNLKISDSSLLSGPISGISFTHDNPPCDPPPDVLPQLVVAQLTNDRLTHSAYLMANKQSPSNLHKQLYGQSSQTQPLPVTSFQSNPAIGPQILGLEAQSPATFGVPVREDFGGSSVGWLPGPSVLPTSFYPFIQPSPYSPNLPDVTATIPYAQSHNMLMMPSYPYLSQPLYVIPFASQMISNTSLVSQAPLFLPNWNLQNMHLGNQPATLPVSHQSRTPRHSAQASVPSWTPPNLVVPFIPPSLTPNYTRSDRQNNQPFPRRSGTEARPARTDKGRRSEDSVTSRSGAKRRIGFHNNILYKTELCHDFRMHQSCPRGPACQYAHGERELRDPRNHPLYKTTICQNYHLTGSCVRGSKCLHLHPLETNNTSSSHLIATSSRH